MTQTDMTIVVGSEDPTNPPSHRSKRKFVQKKKIKKVIFHPLFDNPAAKFDLALVEIKGRFSFRDSRSPICIPDMVKNLAIYIFYICTYHPIFSNTSLRDYLYIRSAH